MTVSTTKNVEDELVNFARSLVKDPSSRHTTTSQTFTATAGQTEFVLTNTGVCVNSVTVAGTAKTWGSGYTYDGDTKTVTLVTGATVGQSVVVSYDYVYYWGYWGYPAVSTAPGNYPIFGITWLTSDSEIGDLGANFLVTDRFFRVWVYAENKDVIKAALAEFRGDFFGKTDWYIDGKAYNRIIPISMFKEPEPDERRVAGRNRWFGSYQDFMIPNVDESK